MINLNEPNYSNKNYSSNDFYIFKSNLNSLEINVIIFNVR